MFEKPTVLIVGAGASADFGLPLGPKLLETFINQFFAAKIEFGNQGPIMVGKLSNSELWDKRHRAVYEAINRSEQSVSHLKAEDLEKFVDVARFQTEPSIDRFLRDHPEHSEIGRFLIAFEILSSCYSQFDELENRRLPDFKVPLNTKWVAKLINEIREASDVGPKAIQDNKISIINFNYDQIIESALDAQLANTSVHKGVNWSDFLEIIHVYGKIEVPQGVFNFNSVLSQSAKNASQISYIHNSKSEEVFRSRIAACRKLLADAEKIVSLGFAFDDANVELLGLESYTHGKKITALNYDGNIGLTNSLEKLGVINIFKPTNPRKPMLISEAIDFGLLR
jgi:hypothetical protein